MQSDYKQTRSRIIDIKILRTLNNINKYLNKDYKGLKIHVKGLTRGGATLTLDMMRGLDKSVRENLPPTVRYSFIKKLRQKFIIFLKSFRYLFIFK
jgi:hypothetical protein